MRKEIEGAFRELTGAVNDWLHMHTITKGVPYLEGMRALGRVVQAAKVARHVVEEMDERKDS